MTDRPTRTLDRYAQLGDLAQSVRWLLQRTLIPLAILLATETGLLFISGSRGASAFGLIAVGTLVVLTVWRTLGNGLPIVPLLAVQNLLVYGLPIVINHEVLGAYPEGLTTRAGLEVLIFSVAMTAAWAVGMGMLHPGSSVSYALQGFRQERGDRLKRLGFSLILAASGYMVLQGLGLLDSLYASLPSGSFSVILSMASAASVCGFFLVGMFVGARALTATGQLAFWLLLALNTLISAADFLLSAATATLASVLIGLFWSTGRMPWRYVTLVALVLSFLNLGKFTMRERYWSPEGDDAAPQFTLTQMPRHYGEWIEASYAALNPAATTGSFRDDPEHSQTTQSLLERINNLQNLLFVLDAMDNGHIAPLGGETYTLIPPLLVPRIFWPDKPRTHEGQVLLNVHFGRQELESTLQTYIAWGLLPEACGNFGERSGGLILGLALGLLCAWLENFTTRKLLLSLEGFVAFTILLAMANSFEMVSSVLVTTIFQSVVMLVFVGVLFVERTQLRRPADRTP